MADVLIPLSLKGLRFKTGAILLGTDMNTRSYSDYLPAGSITLPPGTSAMFLHVRNEGVLTGGAVPPAPAFSTSWQYLASPVLVMMKEPNGLWGYVAVVELSRGHNAICGKALTEVGNLPSVVESASGVKLSWTVLNTDRSWSPSDGKYRDYYKYGVYYFV